MPRRNVFAEEFDPVLAIGDFVAFLGNAGFKQASEGGSGLYVCTMVEPTLLSLGQHGIVVIWTDSGSAAAGYVADPGMQATTNHIAAAGSYAYQLQSLQFPKGQLAQLRFRLKFFATVTGAVDDYDVSIYSPPAIQRAKFQRVGGVINTMFQSQDPGDSIVAPAQGANITLPAVFPNTPPSHWSARTQMFLLENASMQVSILNNGSGATSGGGLGLAVCGWVYNFEPVENFTDIAGRLLPRQILPSTQALLLPSDLDPAEVVILPVEGRMPR